YCLFVLYYYNCLIPYLISFPTRRSSDLTAVFLSHAHLDHSKMINYLDPAIDLYARKETKAILKELNRTGDFLLPSPFEKANFTRDRKSTRLNSSHVSISYAVFSLKKKKR